MHWMKVTMTPEEAAAGRITTLQNAFGAVFMAFNAPPEAAMLSRRNRREFDCYFSPDAARIAEATLTAYDAKNCEAPPLKGTSLLLGHDGIEKKLLK